MTLRIRGQRALLCAAAFAALAAAAVFASPGMSAGATAPALSASTTQLNFRWATLGTYIGPLDVTLTNNSPANDKVTGYYFSGDNDFLFDNAQSQCTLALAPGGSCTLEFDFLPGALGTRNETVQVIDTANSGITISMSGLGTIGYYQVSPQGLLGYHGDAAFYGDLSHTALNKPIVGMAATGDDGGYWLVASDGGVFNFGTAPFLGSTGGMRLNKPIVGMSAYGMHNAGSGYWLVASDGGIFAYKAPFYGSTGAMPLNKPIVGMATTNDGGGYWLVASDGGIFAYGDAGFYGSTGAMTLSKPIVGMVPTPDDGGYWMVASDGGIFTFGDAPFFGSTGGFQLAAPVVGMTAMPNGSGYWLSAADGGMFSFGAAPFYGSGGIGETVGIVTDGVPPFQAEQHQPAIRQSTSGPSTSAQERTAGVRIGLPPGTPRYVGP